MKPNLVRVMKNTVCRLTFPLALLLICGACHKEPDMKSSVTELEKAFPAPVAAAPATPSPTAAPAPATADAGELVRSALIAARANDYASGVIALQAAQARPGITADQVAAVQQAKQAMVAELQRRAVNGDQQALAQLKTIEKSRSQ